VPHADNRGTQRASRPTLRGPAHARSEVGCRRRLRAEERRGLISGRVVNHGAAADAINLSPLLRVNDSERRHASQQNQSDFGGFYSVNFRGVENSFVIGPARGSRVGGRMLAGR